MVNQLQPGRVLRGLLILLAAAWLGVTGEARAEQVRFIAPEAINEGHGRDPQNATYFRDAEFWGGLNELLAEGPVRVIFLNGRYVVSVDREKKMPTLQLDGLGHEQHQLVLEGETAGEVIFTRDPADPDYTPTNNKGPGLLIMREARNVVVRNLTFTAPRKPIGYATNFRGVNILIEDCHWHDLQGVFFGASGTAFASSSMITFRNCRFERVGSSAQAHMIYNAYDPTHVRVIDCYFEDCAGEYIRFRDNTEYGVVAGCTFISTGKYTNRHKPFVAVPLFNDDNPDKAPAQPNYEYFGTHFLICNNTFSYADEAEPEGRVGLLFHHSGFNPPGRSHLLDPAEAAVLREGTREQKQALLLANMGIDTRTVHVYDNFYRNVAYRGAYRSRAAKGAAPRGGEGIYDISETFNDEPVVGSLEAAMEYFVKIGGGDSGVNPAGSH